jgi:hypothetical protein
MSTVLGFDIYGTLIDTSAVGAEIEALLPAVGPRSRLHGVRSSSSTRSVGRR